MKAMLLSTTYALETELLSYFMIDAVLEHEI